MNTRDAQDLMPLALKSNEGLGVLAQSVVDAAYCHGDCTVSFDVLAGAGLGYPHTADPTTGAVTVWCGERALRRWCRQHGLVAAGANTHRGQMTFRLKRA